ncbi:helix-turn-helix domain-containing protein [Ensifer adhaerens]
MEKKTMTLGEQLAAARKAKKIRQHVVAEELGVTIQAVSQWERDKTVPSALNLARLSSFLGVQFKGMEALKNIPMLGKPASYAPMIVPFSTLFYGQGKQPLEDEAERFSDSDFLDFDFDNNEMVPITWQPAGNVFAMRIEDRSMVPQFLPGDIVIVDSGVAPEPGAFVVAQKYPSKGGLVRKYQSRGEDEEGRALADLSPLNPDYPTDTIVVGKTGEITGFIREFRRMFGEK